MIDAGILAYLKELNTVDEDCDLQQVYLEAKSKNIPVIRRTIGQLLTLFARLKSPTNILEIGTGSGYSTLCIRKGVGDLATIVSLERDRNRYEDAYKLFENYKNIKLLYIDAFRYFDRNDFAQNHSDRNDFTKNTQKFDYVFLDAQKRDYIELFPLIKHRLNQGGIFIVDNILFGGKVVNLSDLQKDKYSSGIDLLKRFNRVLADDSDFETVFLSVDDGISISIKK